MRAWYLLSLARASDSTDGRLAVKAYPPYTEEDWYAAVVGRMKGERLACPECGSHRDFYPKTGKNSDGTERHYQACRMCGFWQEADGTPAYRCWKSTHRCDPGLPAEEEYSCEHCSQTQLSGPHDCEWYLKLWEEGYACVTCGQYLGRETKRAWPSSGSS